MARRLHPDHPIDTDLRLADGSVYRIRPSGRDDRQLLADCFDSLSPHSRRLRFFNGKQHLTPQDLDLFSGADGRDHIALAAVRIDEVGRERDPVGFARCFRLAPGGTSAEFSVTVSDRFQGQGVGTALLGRLIGAARAQGIRRFRFEVMAENQGMRRLARQLGGDARWLGDGIVEYDCALPQSAPPDLAQTLVPTRPGPMRPAPARDLPWYLDPGEWMAVWTAPGEDAVQANLEHCLLWVRAANEGLDRWLEVA